MFAFTFLCAGIVQIAVLPFHMTDHGIEHFVKFDFRFREQMQLILFAVASLGALYCYSSAQEITDMELWMNPEGFTMGCDFMRRLLYSTIVRAAATRARAKVVGEAARPLATGALATAPLATAHAMQPP